jgi:hypothetical protein
MRIVIYFFVVAGAGGCGRIGRPSEEIGQTRRKLVFVGVLYRWFIIVFLELLHGIGIIDWKNKMLKELMLSSCVMLYVINIHCASP